MKKEKVYNEAVSGDEGFTPGDGYPSCDGEPCANVSDETDEATDTLADGEPAAEADAAKALEEAVAQWQDKYVRLQAEFDNYRKRTTKEKDGIYQDAKGDTIKTFLAVYDNLERAAAAEGGEDDPHKKGLEMIFHQFKELLAKEGVKEIEAKGKEFDPELMDAVMHIEDERLGENVVAQVFQAGFELNGKVLLHAIVQVAN